MHGATFAGLGGSIGSRQAARLEITAGQTKGLLDVEFFGTNGAAQQFDGDVPMKLSDISCPSCLASYEVAESTSIKGTPGRAQCIVCGGFLEAWEEPTLRVYRLTLSSERKYPSVPIPPSPAS